MSSDAPTALPEAAPSASTEPATPPRFEVKPELFPRSVDALSGDRFLPAGTALVIAFALLACWVAWLFVAPITVSVSSRRARVDVRQAPDSSGADVSIEIVAVFDGSQVGGRVKPGQPAQLRLDSGAVRTPAVDATVKFVDMPRANGDIEVTLDARGGRELARPGDFTGTVHIAVERATPVTLLLRASGWRPSAASTRGASPP